MVVARELDFGQKGLCRGFYRTGEIFNKKDGIWEEFGNLSNELLWGKNHAWLLN